MLLRLAVAAIVLAALAAAYAAWRRPSRRLRRSELAMLGIGGPAVVQFTTPDCGPCKAAVPVLESTARQAALPFRQVDLMDRPDVARRLGIRTVPTIAVTGRRGQVLRAWTSLPPDGEIAEAARKARASG